MEATAQKATRVIARDLLNALSLGMDVAKTVDTPAQKAAALGGAFDRTIEKYELDSGQVAALAVLMDELPVANASEIDYASIEKRIYDELHGAETGRMMQLTENLTVQVSGKLAGWQQAQALYAMISEQALEGLNAYYVEHGIKPIDTENPWTVRAYMVALAAQASIDSEVEPAIRAAQCGMLAYLALLKHSQDLVAMDTSPPVNDLANGGQSDNARIDTGRNAPESPPIQQLPTKPAPTADIIDGHQTAFCMKCHEQVEPKDAEIELKGKRAQFKGTCPTCGTKVSKFLANPK